MQLTYSYVFRVTLSKNRDLNVDGKRLHCFSTRFAAMLQNKMHVFVARFTEA